MKVRLRGPKDWSSESVLLLLSQWHPKFKSKPSLPLISELTDSPLASVYKVEWVKAGRKTRANSVLFCSNPIDGSLLTRVHISRGKGSFPTLELSYLLSSCLLALLQPLKFLNPWDYQILLFWKVRWCKTLLKCRPTLLVTSSTFCLIYYMNLPY